MATEAKDWSSSRRDSAAQQQWGAFLVKAGLTQQAAIDMDEEKFAALVREHEEDHATRELFIGRRTDLWNQFFGMDTSGRRASIGVAGLDGAETAQAAAERGAESKATAEGDDAMKALWGEFLSKTGKTEQDVFALNEKDFDAVIHKYTEDRVLMERLRGHHSDLVARYCGHETKRGSMQDGRVRRSSFTRNTSANAVGGDD